MKEKRELGLIWNTHMHIQRCKTTRAHYYSNQNNNIRISNDDDGDGDDGNDDDEKLEMQIFFVAFCYLLLCNLLLLLSILIIFVIHLKYSNIHFNELPIFFFHKNKLVFLSNKPLCERFGCCLFTFQLVDSFSKVISLAAASHI